MLELIWDPSFLRIFKKWVKRHPDLKEQFSQKLTLFSQDPFHPALKTHKLSGNLKAYWAFSISYEHRLVFQFLSENQILLIAIGSHDEVY